MPHQVERQVSQALPAATGTALGRLVETRRQAEAARRDSGFALLDSVESAFSARLALIESAQKTLDLQYYAIHADASTEILLQRLKEAAHRGVRVRLLLDDFNTAGPDAQVLRLGFVKNIEVRLFNPLPGSRNSLFGRILGSLHDIPRIQRRMHNKLFIADNALGITGGRNLGDAYFGHGETSNFVDLDVLAVGRAVRDMSNSFDRYWNNELAYPAQALLTRAELDTLAADAAKTSPAPPANAAPSASAPLPAQTSPAEQTILPNVDASTASSMPGPLDLQRQPLVWASSALMVDHPDKIAAQDDDQEAGETVVDGLLQLMRGVRKDLLIVSPYFVPGAEMMQVYGELREKGVRIRVLTNSLASNDAPAAHAGYARYRSRLLDLGVELYEMRSEQDGAIGSFGSAGSRARSAGSSGGTSSRSSLHSKAVVLDGRLLVVGSMNLDLRSQLKNSEVALLIRSDALSRAATRQLETTIAKGAYRLEKSDGRLSWRAPPNAPFGDADNEPDASLKLRLLVNLLGPFAPESML